MSLINYVNLIILLENKILLTNKARKKTTIQYKRWIFANIIEIYLHNISKTSQWSYLLIK